MPSLTLSEATGVVSIARIERPQFYRGGSASTETIPVALHLPFQVHSLSLEGGG